MMLQSTAREPTGAWSGTLRPAVSVILPAYNEAAGIQQALADVTAVLNTIGLSYEIIVGDSGSTDGTGVLVEAAALPYVRTLRLEAKGKGRILSHALRHARGEIIGFIDSDMEISADQLIPAIAAVRAGADAAIGSKVIGDTASRSAFRRAVTAVANRLIRAGLGTPFSDHQAGLKVFRRGALIPYLGLVRATGWLWDTELVALLAGASLRIEEVPVRTRPNRPSRFSSLSQLTTASMELVAVCWRVRASRSEKLEDVSPDISAFPAAQP